MAAYLIVNRRDITDAAALGKYGAEAVETLAVFGGKVLARSDAFDVLEGEWLPGRRAADTKPEGIVVVEFPEMANLKDWYGSDDYAELKTLRQRSSSFDFVAIEGL